MSTTDGEKLIEQCQQHILATMRNLPECAPEGADLLRPIEREFPGDVLTPLVSSFGASGKP